MKLVQLRYTVHWVVKPIYRCFLLHSLINGPPTACTNTARKCHFFVWRFYQTKRSGIMELFIYIDKLINTAQCCRQFSNIYCSGAAHRSLYTSNGCQATKIVVDLDSFWSMKPALVAYQPNQRLRNGDTKKGYHIKGLGYTGWLQMMWAIT